MLQMIQTGRMDQPQEKNSKSTSMFALFQCVF